MLFKDVLHILQNQVDSIGITNTLLYTMLFTDTSLHDAEVYTDRAKKALATVVWSEMLVVNSAIQKGFPNL